MKRDFWNKILQLRIDNQNDILILKNKLSINKYDIRSRLLLEEKIKRDQELKVELLALDEEINNEIKCLKVKL